MTATLQDSDFQSSGTSNQLPLTTKTLTVAVGDIITVKGACEDNATAHRLGNATSSAGATVTWTKQAENVTTLNNTYNVIWTGKVTAITTGTITVSLAQSGVSQFHSMRVNQWRNGQLAATPAICNASGGSAPSTTITATGSGNIIDWMVGDWAAIANASPTGRTTSATPTFEIQEFKTGNYRVDFWHQVASGASAQTIGETAPTGQTSWIVGIEIQSASGTNYTPSQSDAVGLTDSVTATQDMVRSVVDALGITDTTVVAQVVARLIADPIGLTDTTTVTQDLVRTQSDAVGITDSVTATIGAVKIVTDPIGITDSAAVAQGLARTTSDPLGITDAASAMQNNVRAISDAVGITDDVTAVITGATTAYRVWPTGTWPTSDAADYTDYSMGLEVEFTTAGSITAIYWWKATATSPPPTQVGVYDVVSGIIIGSAEAVADPGTATGWIKYVLATPIPVTTATRYQPTVYAAVMGYSAIPYYWDVDPAGPTPGPGNGGITSGPIFVPDNHGATNGQQKFNNTNPIAFPNSAFHAQWYGIDVELTVAGGGGTDYTKTVDDSIGITDAATAVQDTVRVQSDPVVITDAVSTAANNTRTISDPVGITDSVTATIGAVKTVTDPIGITDAVTVAQGLARTQSDSIGITDSVTAVLSGHDYAVTINDAIGITDTSVQQAIDYNYILDPDPIGITDDVTATLSGATAKIITDPIGITDTASAQQDIARALSDPVGITDAASAAQALARTVNDPIGITDSVTAVIIPAGAAVVTDPIGITDTTSVTQANARTQTDPVGITDAVSTAAGLARLLADPIGITDAVTAVLSQGHNYVVTINDGIGITDAATVTKAVRDVEVAIMAAPDRLHVSSGPARIAVNSVPMRSESTT